MLTGQVMQAVLDGLKPQTTYTYRAFVRTTGGTTYGEEQTFTTEMPTGIDYMETEKAAPHHRRLLRPERPPVGRQAARPRHRALLRRHFA